MSDISALVQYEQAFRVDLVFAGKPVGISMDIISFDSERVTKAVRPIDSKKWAAVFANDDKKLSPEQIMDLSDEAEKERLIASIVSWDFGGNSFGDLHADPECTEDNKRYVIQHVNAKWIRDQLAAKGADLGNFTQASAKPAARKSKEK